MRPLRPILLPLTVLLLLPATATADWLVTREGARVETQGPWKVKGAVVVFTLPNGTLSSMRVRELDLDESALLTAEAAKPPEEETAAEEASEPKPVVAELTNANVRRASPTSEEGEDGEEDAQEATPPKAVATPPYEVISWDVVDRPEIDGVEVRGTLRNAGQETMSNISVVIRLLTPDDAFVGERRGTLQSTLLRAQAATNFNVAFPSLPNEPYKLEVDVAAR